MADVTATVGSISFPSPVLTAPGPNVRDSRIINKAVAAGVGGIVAKTISTTPAAYPKPAMARAGDGGLINCETWSDRSAEENIQDFGKIDRSRAPLVISIGYSESDMRALGPEIEKRLNPAAIEFSTHYQGKGIDGLVGIARALRESVSIPIWMKISPGQPDLEALIEATEGTVDAYVAINSLGPALDFSEKRARPSLGSPHGYGWLSGPAILPIALQTVHRISLVTEKPIVGVGGIATGVDAAKFLMAGASAVQVCTAAILHGPKRYAQIASELSDWLDANGYESVSQITGRFGRDSADL